MIIDFGYKKVSIEAGISKEGVYICKLQKLLEANNLDAIGDVPCYLQFHNKEGLEALIISLTHLLDLMRINENE